jgi:hypothetical protein
VPSARRTGDERNIQFHWFSPMLCLPQAHRA